MDKIKINSINFGEKNTSVVFYKLFVDSPFLHALELPQCAQKHHPNLSHVPGHTYSMLL
jgi:hypothetical protein